MRALSDAEVDSLGSVASSPSVSPPLDFKALQSLLRGKCLAYNTEPPSWWTTEWCHRYPMKVLQDDFAKRYRKEIHQFHLHAVAEGRQQGKQTLYRDPNWSMGKFKRSKVIHEGNNKSLPIQEVREM